MRIAIVGAGAMGSLMAGRLAAAIGKHGTHPDSAVDAVVLYGRPSAHLDAIRAHGLTIVERSGASRAIPVTATTEAADVEGCDVVVVLVKAWASAEAAAPLCPYLTRDTVVITLQNGLGNASALRSALLRDGVRPHVYLGVTTQGAMRTEPGVIVHTGSGITALGRRTNPVNTQLRDIANAMTFSGLQTVAVDDIHRWVWRKLAVNAAINPLTALAGVENSVISTDPGLRAAAEAVAREVVAVGKATGVKIDLKEVLAAIDDVARATGDNRSSMLVDVESGTPTEIDAINGAVVSEARRHAIKVPANQLMTALVRAREGRYQADQGGDADLDTGAIA
ncbi:MAG: 2-dehydropantoate 2-reductase [Chloroflexia bacterium]|nr:2-dehydropantoate 2-reductase [Chloroflexia bacterium]